VTLKQTNALFRNDAYKDKVMMSKTGLTNMAGQNLAFVTEGNDLYDYITIVFLGSKNRTTDSEKILDWLASNDTSKS
jgi:D-alanyl-D-alanine carboxypeptidase